MECNKEDAEAREQTYPEFPTKYVWDKQNRRWYRRKSKKFSLERLHYIPPGVGEHHYLGLLLPYTKGATCHEDIITIKGVLYENFRDACYSMGLLDDDREYVDGIIEASFWASGHYSLNLFAILLIGSTMNSLEKVFEKTWESMSDDIQSRQRKLLNIPDLSLTNDQLKNFALIEIDKLLQLNGSSLSRFSSMPLPEQSLLSEMGNKLIYEECRYDRVELKNEYESRCLMMTEEQKNVQEQILEAVSSESGGLFFLYGYGGTGKTFIWKNLSASIRSQGGIVLNVASSGIAALLLPGGRTAHSRFAIPININESSICHIKQGTDLSELIVKAKLIIWDEAHMINKFSFEALDRSLRDIVRSGDGLTSSLPFGGKIIVFGGDFRQILLVVQKGSREDIVHVAINSSYIWEHCKVLRLTKNMRLQTGSNESETSYNEIAEFADWILNVGDGNIGSGEDGLNEIEIYEENLILNVDDLIEGIVESIYPSVAQMLNTPNYFDDRAILALTHKEVRSINDKVLSMIDGETKEYLSFDTLSNTEYKK